MENQFIEYTKGWQKKLKYIWKQVKLTSLDLSGWNLEIAERKAKEHNFSTDYLQSFAFRGLAIEKNFHTIANTYFDEELSDGAWDTTNNFNKLIKAIKKRVEEKGFVFVEIDAETWDLEEKSDNPVMVKIVRKCQTEGQKK